MCSEGEEDKAVWFKRPSVRGLTEEGGGGSMDALASWLGADRVLLPVGSSAAAPERRRSTVLGLAGCSSS